MSPKTAAARSAARERSPTFEKRLEASMERLRTDYIDCYYLHGVGGREIALLSDPDVKAAFEKLKKSGKIKFCGLSCHDARLPEIVTAAAESGWMDQIMIQYNYRTMATDAVKKALDAASKANLAIVAMKTQGAPAASAKRPRRRNSRSSSTRASRIKQPRSRRSSPTTAFTRS